LNVILDKITQHLGVDAVDILILNQDAIFLEYAAVRGFNPKIELHAATIRVGESFAGQAAAERKLVSYHISSDDPVSSSFHAMMLEEGFASYYCIPLIAKGQIQGVLEIYNRQPLVPDDDWLEFFEILAGQAAIAIDNATLVEQLRHSNLELAMAYDITLEGWSKALDLRDKDTEGHTQRVTEMTMRLAARVGIRSDELIHVRRGAMLHDIGKMGIPDSILLKPGKLNKAEWKIMRRHPQYAYELLYPIKFLQPALDIPYCHHERWNGTGYPRGLEGELIPLSARVFAVVDVWDALTSNRPYRSAWPRETALVYIYENSNKEFDPYVVEAFFDMINGFSFVSKNIGMQ
jgi:HD-GYP domain-containing protein (c-di-GMP phosphodiesterase class II)